VSETKHTPGPWQECAHLRIPHVDGECKCVASTRGTIWSADGEQIVCEMGESVDADGCWTPPFDRSTTRANARLIAAAPELLKALEGMLNMTQDGWITPEDRPTDWQLGWEAACEQFKIARANDLAVAAIQKAVKS
jgi:hypothetical protein